MDKFIEFWNGLLKGIGDYVIFPIKNISITDILDILVLACLMYMLYKFIRDRHVGRMALGFGAVIVIYVVSDLLHMTAISSILKNFYVVGIVVVCIIFQPELRAALEEVGSTSLYIRRMKRNAKKGADNSDMLHMVEEISAAAFELSSRGDGALIVLERSSRLHSQMTEGVALDAVVSRQLLGNIFVNKSPLHDGAVIIRNMRIVVASSKSKTISDSDDEQMRGLGTRHRAARRISEVSDAVVVVVSEETGIISVANKGNFIRGYQDIRRDGGHKPTDLRDDLYLLMTGKSIGEDSFISVDVDKVDKANRAETVDSSEDTVNTESIDDEISGGEDTGSDEAV